eukprot:g8576.t1
MLAVFYFLIIRPQQKKSQAHREMLGKLKKGDRVVTSAGIVGVISKISDDAEVQLEITEGIRMVQLKSAIVEVRGPSEGKVVTSQDQTSKPQPPKKQPTKTTTKPAKTTKAKRPADSKKES